MKSLLVFIVAMMFTLCIAVGLSSCGGSYIDEKDTQDAVSCAHEDTDGNNLCDKCGQILEGGVDSHTHVYTEQNIDSKYLAADASCKNAASYYYSCRCGKAGTETFTYGDTLPHNFVDNICDDCGCSVYTTGLVFELNSDGASYRVIGIGDFTGTVISIPPTHKNLPVNAIGAFAFDFCRKLTVVSIPNSVTTIGERAFRGCDSLTSINIPNSVDEIDEDAFYGCNSLKNVYIEDITTWCEIYFVSVYSNPIYYSGRFYLNGELVTDLIIPDGVIAISSDAFYNCISLTSVTISSSVTEIGDYAFCGCEKLVEVINKSNLNIIAGRYLHGYVADYAKEVHTGASKIVNQKDYLFYTYNGVNYLLGHVGSNTELVLPESYNDNSYEIYKYAWYDCDDIISVVIPDSVTAIYEYAFWDCGSLVSVTIGNGVTAIGEKTFEGCGMTNIVIPYSVKTIGEEAFAACPHLASVTVGNGVTAINSRAFYGCLRLSRINYRGTEEQWNAILKEDDWNRYIDDNYTIIYNYIDE